MRRGAPLWAPEVQKKEQMLCHSAICKRESANEDPRRKHSGMTDHTRMLSMDKVEIAEILEEMAVLLELREANPFRIRAFHNAARAVEAVTEDLVELALRGELTKIPGVGKGISAVIEELLKSGKCKDHEHLKKHFPKGFLEILRIPGVGAKRAKVLYEKLGVKSVAELERACRKDWLAELEGFGEKSQSNILRGIEHYLKTKGFFLISQAEDEAGNLVEYLKKQKGIEKISVAGSLRRRKEVVHDADILASTRKHETLHEAFTRYPEVEQVAAKGDTKSSIVLKSGLQVDLRTVSAKEYPFALHYLTGSKEHNVAIRTLAKRRGYKINEYGLFKGNRLIPCRSEEEIYRKFGMAYIEPELRENMGEIEAAKIGAVRLPVLIEEKDIKGTFHVHTTYSDGRSSLEDMVRAAASLGYEYVGIADHSRSAVYAGGLTEEKIKRQHAEIDRLGKKYKSIRIFKGIESDILKDGSLDYPDRVLGAFDFIVASIHSRFSMNEKEMTKRILRAMENPFTTMLGHLTGRLLLSREGYAVDNDAVLEQSRKTGCLLELNAHPQRLDVDWRVLIRMKKMGLLTVINPDAHDAEGFDVMRYGVGIARKGWLEKKDVLNTLSAEKVAAFLAKRTPRL